MGSGSKLRRQQGHRGSRRVSATARCRRKVAIDAGLCRSGRTGGVAGAVVGRPLGRGEPGPPARGGKAAALGHQEGVGRDAQGRVVVEAAPAAALEVPQAELLLELLEVALDAPAQLGGGGQLLERGRLGQRGEPVLGRSLLVLGPLGEEPLLGARLAQAEVVVRRPDPDRGEARGQRTRRALAPGDGPPRARPRAGRWPASRPRAAGARDRAAAASAAGPGPTAAGPAAARRRVATRSSCPGCRPRRSGPDP
jgi:hypothetical protein